LIYHRIILLGEFYQVHVQVI